MKYTLLARNARSLAQTRSRPIPQSPQSYPYHKGGKPGPKLTKKQRNDLLNFTTMVVSEEPRKGEVKRAMREYLKRIAPGQVFSARTLESYITRAKMATDLGAFAHAQEIRRMRRHALATQEEEMQKLLQMCLG